MKRVILLSVSILLISLAYSFAEVPCKINYQGRLIKDNVPVDGTKTMKFSIYDSAVGPTLLWTSGDVSVEVHNGLFRYVIGNDGGDLSTLDWTAGQALYLEVQVEADILTPREELSAYPYAINSHLLEGKAKEYFLDTSGDSQTKQGDLNIMGNVGIGTTTPQYTLDVQGGPNTAIRVHATSGMPYFYLSKATQRWGWHIALLQHNFQLVDASHGKYPFRVAPDTPTDTLYLDYTGNVGIGTPSPQAKLHIDGTPGTDGIMFPDGSLQTTAAEGGVFGFWTDKDSANNTLVKDAVYKVGSDGTVIALISCSGMSNYDRGYITSYTDGSNSPTTDRGYAGYMQYGTNITKASITMPVRKDDYWKVTFTRLGGNCAVTVTMYWIPIGSGSCVKQ